ncbi:MAG: hypothetical protein U5P41_14470 [Gammaproteobacteria bacterium]|nr:hypothetical protein [Gammaproteobacteria bacterium]
MLANQTSATELSPSCRQCVEAKLEGWAAWSAKLEDLGLGYPARVNYYSQPRNPGEANPNVPACILDDEAAMKVEAAVRDLPQLLRDVVVAEWLHRGTRIQKSKLCHCDPERRLRGGLTWHIWSYTSSCVDSSNLLNSSQGLFSSP